MRSKLGSKVLSVLLMLAVVLSYMPVVSFADDTATKATAVSSLDALVSGKYVLVAEGKGGTLLR